MVIVKPIARKELVRFLFLGEVTQEHEDDASRVFVEAVESPYTRGWYQKDDLIDVFGSTAECRAQLKQYAKSKECKELIEKRKSLGVRPRLAKNGDQLFNEHCDSVWGKNFTRSWQIRKTLDAKKY